MLKCINRVIINYSMSLFEEILNDFGLKVEFREQKSLFNKIPILLKEIYDFSLVKIENEFFIIARQKK